MLLLRLHRWIALVFALPLLAIIGSGLLLAVEPALQVRSIVPGSITAARVQALLARHDPAGEADAVSFRGYDHTLTIATGRGKGGRVERKVVDVASGEVRPAMGALATVMTTARRMHETLLLDANWLVLASTLAMLAFFVLGIMMGPSRFVPTLGGWHRRIAWTLLPLVVLSPLTGLMLDLGVTFQAPRQQRDSGPAPSLSEAVGIVAREHDIAGLVLIRQQRGAATARLLENGAMTNYVVTAQGLRPMPANWPRLWHEGNFAGTWSALINTITALALLGLLCTGTWQWAARTWRRRGNRPERAAA